MSSPRSLLRMKWILRNQDFNANPNSAYILACQVWTPTQSRLAPSIRFEICIYHTLCYIAGKHFNSGCFRSMESSTNWHYHCLFLIPLQNRIQPTRGFQIYGDSKVHRYGLPFVHSKYEQIGRFYNLFLIPWILIPSKYVSGSKYVCQRYHFAV